MEQNNNEQGLRNASKNTRTTKMVVVLVVIIVGVGGFVGGMQYQKGYGTSQTARTFGQGRQGAMGGGFTRNGSLGTVTAVDTTSITVQDQRAGGTKTYAIDSSTKIADGDTTASVSDVVVGDRVMVQTSSSSSTTATQITRNPSMGGGPGSQSNSDSTDQSQQDSSNSSVTN